MQERPIGQRQIRYLIIFVDQGMDSFLETEHFRCSMMRRNPELHESRLTVEQMQIWTYKETIYERLLLYGRLETFNLAEEIKREEYCFYPTEFMAAFVDVKIKIAFFQKKKN